MYTWVTIKRVHDIYLQRLRINPTSSQWRISGADGTHSKTFTSSFEAEFYFAEMMEDMA
jgi:hypothetical protein